jgi:NTP pyrophosphatase (non-canonical NTP hydrolase)
VKDSNVGSHNEEASNAITDRRIENLKRRGMQDLPIEQWYLILSEEIGEIAKAINQSEGADRVYEELKDAGAVIVAMMTSIISDRETFEDRGPL